MSWATSKKFRFQWRKFSRQIDVAEKRLRTRVESTVKVYTPEEIATYVKEREKK